jgi:protein CpxP
MPDAQHASVTTEGGCPMSESPRTTRTRRLVAYALIPLAAVLLGAGLLHAQQAMHHGGSMHEVHAIDAGHVHEMLDKLGVTAAQQQRIDPAVQTVLSEMTSMHSLLDDTHLKLHELLLAPAIDRGQLEALRGEQLRALDAASLRMLSALEDVAEAMTPEQRAALAAQMRSVHGG